MNELIRIMPGKIAQVEVQTVDARELHAFLESRADFSTWIKERIEQYGFFHGEDFEVFHQTGENPVGTARLCLHFDVQSGWRAMCGTPTSRSVRAATSFSSRNVGWN